MKEKEIEAKVVRQDFMRAEYDQVHHVYAMKDKHSHKECEIFLMIDGHGTVNIDNRFIPIQKGSLVLIPSNIPHRFDMMDSPSHTRVVIEFDPDYMADIVHALINKTPLDFFNEYFGVFNIEGKTFDVINADLREIVGESLGKADGYLSMLVILLTKFMVHVGRDISTPSSKLTKDSSEKLVNEVVKIIHQEITSQLSLEELSKRLFVNKAYLSRVFKKYQKVSVQSYINVQKINVAKQLLLAGNKSIDGISTDIGYSTRSYFSRVFKAETGMTPTQYRRNVKITDQLTNDYYNRAEQSKKMLESEPSSDSD